MSPLLGISLAIIVLLWVIPLAWAVSTGIRALPRLVGDLIGFLRNAPTLFSVSKREQQMLRRAVNLEQEYQSLQTNLVQTRAQLSTAIEERRELLRQIKKLIDEIQIVEKIQNPAPINYHKRDIARNQLPQFERNLATLEFKIASLREQLSENELAVQKAYTRKQVLIAADKFALAEENANRLLNRPGESTDARLRAMEQKIVEREIVAYGVTNAAKVQQDHLKFVDSALRLQLESLSLDELLELLQTINDVAAEISFFISESEATEELVSMQLRSSEADLQSWKHKAAEAAAEDRQLLIKQAEVNQLECEVQIAKQIRQLKEERNKLADLRLLEMKLAKRKDEILMKIADVQGGDMDFSPGE